MFLSSFLSTPSFAQKKNLQTFYGKTNNEPSCGLLIINFFTFYTPPFYHRAAKRRQEERQLTGSSRIVNPHKYGKPIISFYKLLFLRLRVLDKHNDISTETWTKFQARRYIVPTWTKTNKRICESYINNVGGGILII